MKNQYRESIHFQAVGRKASIQGGIAGPVPISNRIPLSNIASILAGKSNQSGGVKWQEH
jgi:hypothetical protein